VDETDEFIDVANRYVYLSSHLSVICMLHEAEEEETFIVLVSDNCWALNYCEKFKLCSNIKGSKN